MKRNIFSAVVSLAAVIVVAGCGKFALVPATTAKLAEVEQNLGKTTGLSREQENRILALNPDRVTESDVRNVLAGAPAPRIIAIHGGLASVQPRLASFGRFMIGMGYPERAIRNPGNGDYTISSLENAEMIAGIGAWYYEREGMRPMIIGHSQGSMQAVKTLQLYAGQSADRLTVWSPLTWKPEERTEITDPLTGNKRPVVGLSLSYVAALSGGGASRMLPNQWDIMFSLRAVPNTVDEFTGFYFGFDPLGGDYLGFGPSNNYHATGTAKVRNVQLPTNYTHMKTPDIERLLSNPRAIEWINNYVPSSAPSDPEGMGDVKGIIFGADVWKSVKRHWVIELQRLIRARRGQAHGH